MLSLAEAAKLAYRAATKRENPTEQPLNNVARIIAARIRIFACEPGDCANPAMVMPDEVFEGEFEGGGMTLNFKDARPSLTNLCMLHKDLGEAIAEVRAAYRNAKP
jgi:hypothetical protein